jgi:hypothetical protein
MLARVRGSARTLTRVRTDLLEGEGKWEGEEKWEGEGVRE